MNGLAQTIVESPAGSGPGPAAPTFGHVDISDLDVDPGLLERSEEQRSLGVLVRDLLQSHAAPEPPDLPTAFNGRLWREMADLGLAGIVIPAEFSGSGGDFRDLLVVMEESGRMLAPIPLLSTAVAVAALLATDDDGAQRRHLPGIAAGTTLAALAAPAHGVGRGYLTATLGPSGWTISGRVDCVVDGADADLFLAVADTGVDGVSVFSCAADAPGLTRTARTVLDPSRPQCLVALDAVPAEAVGVPGGGNGVAARAADIGRVALAAELIGVVDRTMQMTMDYVSTRTQFNRRIGSFQAVKHRLADLLVACEGAKSAVALAGACAAGAPEMFALTAAMARVVSVSAADLATRECIQLHGGIGFTWEHQAHRYFRRATSAAALFGTNYQNRERIADLIGMPTCAEGTPR